MFDVKLGIVFGYHRLCTMVARVRTSIALHSRLLVDSDPYYDWHRSCFVQYVDGYFDAYGRNPTDDQLDVMYVVLDRVMVLPSFTADVTIAEIIVKQMLITEVSDVDDEQLDHIVDLCHQQCMAMQCLSQLVDFYKQDGEQGV